MVEFIDTYFWLIVIVGAFFSIAISSVPYTKPENNMQKKNLRLKLRVMDNFDATQKVESWGSTHTIAIDEKRKKISFCSTGETWKTTKCMIYNYRDILEVEILEDGRSIIKTSRSSQLGGALVGGMLFGELGAVVGGLSGSKYETGETRTIILKILVNDMKSPMQTLYLYDNIIGAGIDVNSKTHKEVIMEARKWHSLISVLIHQADDEDNAKESKDNIKFNNNLSIADEIIKLKSLSDENIITENEYLLQKDKLLKQ